MKKHLKKSVFLLIRQVVFQAVGQKMAAKIARERKNPLIYRILSHNFSEFNQLGHLNPLYWT
jgi:hypothetical protein